MNDRADSPGVRVPPPLIMNTWWPVLLLIPTLVAIQRFVILREELYLHRRFGAEYEAYTRRVRR